MKFPNNLRQYVMLILTLFLLITLGGRMGKQAAAEAPADEKQAVVAETPGSEAPSSTPLMGKYAMMEEATCETCHGTLEEVAANTTPTYPENVDTEAEKAALVTQVFPINPHRSHYGEMKCTQCHKDGKITLYCNTCHDFQMEPRSKMVTVSDKSCLKCHENYDKVAMEITLRYPPHVNSEIQKAAAVTQVYPANPHQSHYGEIKCTQCHRIHSESRLYCNTCHDFQDKVNVP